MTTEQSYVGGGNNTPSTPQTAQNGVEDHDLAYYRNATPSDPTRLTLNLSLSWAGRSDYDGGVSDGSVLFDALRRHKEYVLGWPDSNDKELTLESIEDIEHDALDSLLRHASAMTNLLHSMKHNFPIRLGGSEI